MIVILYSIFGLYLIFIGVLTFGIIRGHGHDNKTSLNNTSIKGISILVPFYNGQNHIKSSIDSMKKIKYKDLDLEFLYIDDYSTDSSSTIFNQEKDPRFTILSSSGLKGKKTALKQGVKAAKYDWILTTDVDCMLPDSIINYYGEFLSRNPETKLIAGPVLSKDQNFQSFNLLSLAAFSQASSNLGVFNTLSGANLFYRKSDFLNIQPYKDNLDLPSGDDMFLLKAFKSVGLKNLYFLSNPLNIVETQCLDDTKDFLKQQLRWASKTDRIANPFHIISGILITTGNLSILILSVLLLSKGLLPDTAILWFIKLLIDAFYFSSYSSELKQKINWVKYGKSSLIYPFFTSYIAARILFSPRKKAW